MAYVGSNPTFKSTILRNSSAATEAAPPAGKYKVICVNGVLFVKESGGTETAIVDVSANQTITGTKTFDKELVLKELSSTPSNPSSTYKKFYAKNDGKLYTLDSSGNEIEVGSGAGGGSANLILNPDASSALDQGATDDIGDWIDSSTGVASSKTTTASEIPLEDIKDSAIKLTLASGTNDYTRVRFQVPAGYQNTNLSLSWTQRVSGLSAEDMKVELYNYSDNYVSDVAEVPLFSDDSSGDTYISTGDGAFKTAFSANDREYYELRFINNGGTSGYLSLNEVSVDKNGGANGSVGGWKAYTNSDTGTSVSNYTIDTESLIPSKDPFSGEWFIEGSIAATRVGASTSDQTITFSGVTFAEDASIIVTNVGSALYHGYCDVSVSATTMSIEFGGASNPGAISIEIPKTRLASKPTWADFDGTVNLMDRGITTSNHKAAASTPSTVTMTSTAGAYTVLDFSVEDFDVGNIHSSGTFTIKTTGYYSCTASVSYLVGQTGKRTQLFARVNNTTDYSLDYVENTQAAATEYNRMKGSRPLYLQAGDTVEFNFFSTETASGNHTLSASDCYGSVVRIPDHSALAPVGFGTTDEADSTARYLLPKIQSGEIDVYITNGSAGGSAASMGYTIQGDEVTLNIPSVNYTVGSTNLYLSTSQSSQTWPSELTPTADRYVQVRIIENTTASFGLLKIDSDGVTHQLFKDAGASTVFGGSNVLKGLYPVSVTYKL